MATELDSVVEELGDALTKHGLLNDHASELIAELDVAKARGETQSARELRDQLDIVEARRVRAMALAGAASQRLNQLRRHILEG
jgi:hypothetical protein